MVDSKKEISEENEANNILFADKMVQISEGTKPAGTQTPVPENLPDLTVPDVSSDPEGTAGGVMNVTTSVRNIGAGDAGPFVVELYLSPDTELTDDDILLGMGKIPELPAGTQSDGNAPTPIPVNMTPGVYYFGILVDGENDVTESNETNNILFAKIPVQIR
jgi:subtilase family serine protease